MINRAIEYYYDIVCYNIFVALINHKIFLMYNIIIGYTVYLQQLALK